MVVYTTYQLSLYCGVVLQYRCYLVLRASLLCGEGAGSFLLVYFSILLEKGKENLKTATPGVRGGSPLFETDKGDPHNTRDEIATDLDWSSSKVAKADKVWAKAKQEVKDQVKTGEVSFNKAYQDIRKEERKEERKELINTQIETINKTGFRINDEAFH